MINKQRVQRFRTMIQLVLVLLVVLPVVLMIALCIRMMGALGELTAYLDRSAGTSAAEPAVTAPNEAYSIPPENHSLTNHEVSEMQSSSRVDSVEESASSTVAASEAATEAATAPETTAPQKAESGGSPENPPRGGSSLPAEGSAPAGAVQPEAVQPEAVQPEAVQPEAGENPVTGM